MKKILLSGLLTIFTLATIAQTTYYSIAPGNWNDPNTWSTAGCGGAADISFPVAGDAVFICDGNVVTVNVASACATLDFSTGNTTNSGLTVSENLTVSGAITYTDPASGFNQTITIDAGKTLSCASLSMTNTTDNTCDNFLIINGNLDVNGNLSMPGASDENDLTLNGGGKLYIEADFSVAGATFTAGANSDVFFDGAGAQTVANYTYDNLTLSGSGVKTTATITVNNKLSLQGDGSLSLSAAPTYGASASLEYKGTAAQTTGVEFVSPFTSTGGLIIDNASGVVLNAATTLGDGVADCPLTLTNGVLTTTGANLLTMAKNSTISGYSTANFVEGPLAITIPEGLTASATVFTFPVGKSATYYPFSITTITTGAAAPVVTVEAFAADAGGTANSTSLASISATEYWAASFTGDYVDGSVSLTRQAAISPFDVVARSTTAAGSYSSLHSSGTAGTTINNSCATGNTLDYFVMGEGSCIAPLTQANTIVFGAVTDVSIDLSWTNGNGANRIVVAKQGGAPASTPSDGTSYTASSVFGSGDIIGAGEFVVYNGSSNSVSVTGLSAGTTYFFQVFEYNCSCTFAVYNTSTAVDNPNSTTTDCPEPATQASATSSSGTIGTTQFNISWTNGDGTNRLVVVSTAGAVTATPSDGSSYTASSAAPFGSDIGTSELVAYSGTANNVTITGLTPGTTYYWAVFEFNDCQPDYNITLPATSSETTCTTPTGHATGSAASGQTTTQFQLDWNVGDGNRRIVVVREGLAVNATPSDGTDYLENADFTLGQDIGGGNIVVYDGADNPTGTVIITNLTWGTTYFWKIFEYNTCGPTYYTGGTPESGSTSTTCPEPTTDATPSTSNILSTSFQLDWVNGGDPGSNHLVVVKQGALPFTVFPSDGISYSANSNFTLGQDLGSGNIAVYASTGLSVTITNLSPGTEYSYAVYEFNDCNPNYLSPTTAVGSITTVCDEPLTSSSASSATGILKNQFQLNWSNGSGTNRLVVVSPVGAVTATPVDGSSYAADPISPFSGAADLGTSEFVVYNGTGTNVTLTNLNPGTEYFWAIYEFNDCEPDYKQAAPETSSETTCTVPVTEANGSTTSGVTQTGFTLNWNNGTGQNRIVILRANAPVGADPVDGTTYTANASFGSGTALGGGFCVYNGIGTSVAITNLSWANTYYWEIFENNTCGPTYKSDVTETGNLCAEPTTDASLSSAGSITGTSFSLSWTSGNGTNRLVVLKKGSAVSVSPADLSSYTANSVFETPAADMGGGNYAVYNGTGTSVSITGLEGGATTYYWAIFEYNSCGPNYKTDAPATGNATTLNYYYSNAAGSANLQNLTSWGKKADGSGSNPADFTSDGQIFFISNTTTASTGGAWTVSGTGSRIKVPSGVTTGFTVSAAGAVTGTIDVASSAKLIIDNGTNPTLDTLGTTSTVEYSTNSASIVTRTYEGNLTISKALSLSGSIQVTGALTLNNPLTIGANTLTLNGTIAGSSTIVGSNSLASNISIGGTGAFGTLTMSQTDASSRSLNNVTLNRAASGVITLGARLDIMGTLTMTAGILSLNDQILDFNNGTVSGTVGRIRGSGTSTAQILVEGTGGDVTLYFDQTGSSPFPNRTIGRLTNSRPGATVALGTNLILYNNALSCEITTADSKINIASRTLTMTGASGFSFTGLNSCITGSATSTSISITGSGIDPGTLVMDQTTDGTTNALTSLTMNRPGKTLTLGSVIKPTGLTITAGTITNGGYAISGTGVLSVSATGTLILTGTSTFPSGYGTNTLTSGSTVDYAGTTQSVSAKTYSNLIISGSGTKTLGGNISNMTGTFTISAGTFDDGGYYVDGTGSNTVSMAAGTFYLCGYSDFLPGFGTFSLNATSTVDYYLAGAASVKGVTYGNLIISGSGTKTLLTPGISNMAGTFTISSGTFDDGGFTVDGTGANTISMAAGTFYNCSATDFLTGFGTYTLSATSTVNYDKAGDSNVKGGITYGHLIFSGSGTKTLQAAISNMAGNFTGSGGTFDNNSFNVDGVGTKTFQLDAGATFLSKITPGEAFPTDFASYTLNATSTFEYGAAGAQTIQNLDPNSAIIDYGNITISGSGTKTLSVSITNPVSNLYIKNGTFDNGGFAIISGDTLRMDASTTFILGGTSSMPGFSYNSLNATSTVNYAGTNQNVAGMTYGHLTISGSGTKTLLADINNMAGTFTISAGTFDDDGNLVDGNASNTINMAASTIYLCGATDFLTDFLTFTLNPSSTVNYNRLGDSNVRGIPYGNLIISGSGTKTLVAAISNIEGTFTITSGTFNDGGFVVDGTGANTMDMDGATFYLCSAANFLTDFGTFTLDPTSTVNYNGGSTNVRGGSIVYGNLIASGTGTKTLLDDINNMAGNFTVSAGIFDNAGNNVDGNTLTTFQVDAGATYITKITPGNAFPTDFSSITLDPTSNFEYGAEGAQNVDDLGIINYGNLIISGSGTKTLLSSLTFPISNLTITTLSSVIFNNGGFNIVVDALKTFTMDPNTTFILAGTSSMPSFTSGYSFDASSTVEYSGTTQTVTGLTYGNLTISGSLTKTLSAPISNMAGTFTINGGTFDDGGNAVDGTGANTLAMAASTIYLCKTTDFLNDFTIFSLDPGSLVNYNRAGDANVRGITYGNLTISGSGTKTLQAAISNMAGTFALTAGTFDDGNFTVDGTGLNTITAAASTTYLCGATDFLTDFGTFTLDATSTVNYDRTGAQNVRGIVYGNLISSGTGVKTLQANITNMTGNFTVSAGTFDNNALTLDGNSTGKIFSASAGATFITKVTPGGFPTGFGTYTLDATSNFEYGAAGAQNVDYQSDIPSAVDYGNIIISGSGTKTLIGNLTSDISNLDINAGTFDNGGYTIAVAASKTLTMAAGTFFLLGGTTPMPGFASNSLSGTSTVNYYGTAQNVAGLTYGNLTISGSGTKTLLAAISNMAGTLTVSNGTFDDGGFVVDGTGANTISMAASTTYLCGATDFLTQFGTFSLDASSTVNYQRSGAANVRGIPYGNLIISGSGTKTLQAAIVGMAGTFTIDAGTFDDGDFAVTGTGANSMVLDASTFYLCGVTNFVTGFTGFTLDASSTVDYNRAGAANVRGIAYGNLTISGSGTKTLQAIITNMAGTFTISAGTFDDGDFAVDGTGLNTIVMGASTVYLCGVTDFLSDFGTFTLDASSTVNYDRAGAANVRGITYGNLTISGSGTKTLQGAIANMGGTLAINNGTFDDGNFSVDGTGANTITMAASTFYLCGATNFLTDFGTFTLNSTSTVDYDGADANVRGIPYGYLTLSGTGTKTLAASPTVATDYSVSGVNVDMAAFNIGVTGNYSNSGSVTYSNAGNLNVTGNFSNSAAATLNLGSTTFYLTGNLTNNGGADATINIGTVGINISGNWTNNGTDAIGGSGTITFNSTGTQSVSGPNDFSGTPSVIDNSGGGKVQLADATTTFGDVTINATGILDPVANNFNVAGDWTNDRGIAGFTPVTSQKVTFTGDAARIVGGTGSTKFRDITCDLGPTAARTLSFNTSCNVERVLDVNDGQIVANGNITLVSNASGTAAVGNLSDGDPEATAISGNVICQRFINESGSAKWHLLAGQSTGGTLSDWDDDIYYTGATFTGADYQSGTFVNVLTYDETTNDPVTTGFVGATNVTNTLNNGSTYSGFFVYDQFASEVVDITGEVRSDAADITFPISYTSIPNEYDGYNLFGNPHPCAIDWESVRNNGATTLASVNATMSYMTPSGSYGFLTDDGVPSGDKLIASGEGFWIKATGGGSLVIQETDKVPTGTDPYQNKISGGPLVGLKVTLKQGTYKDSPAMFYFRDSHLGLPVTSGIDQLLDFKKGHTNTLGKENIAAVIENENIAINFLPDSVSQIDIPLRVWKKTPANVSKVYTLEFANVALLKNENKCFVFEDTYAGVSFLLNNDTSYSVTMKDTTYVPRFFLHSSTPIQSTVKDVFCADATDGFITASGSGSGPFNYIWKNQAGDTIRNVSSSVADTLSGIGAGFYYLTVSNNGTCGTAGNSFEIKALNPFDMALSKTDLSCYGDSVGTALITTSGGSGNFTYLWSNGDTLAQATNLKAQVYYVTVTDSLGCSQVDSATISQPSEIAVNPTAMNVVCYGDSNGTALTFVSGGNSPYTYLWSTGSDQTQISNLKSQVYYVTVTDNSGCFKQDSVSIIQPEELLLANASTDVDCYGGSTGAASVLVSGGTSDYSYSWSSGGNTETEQGVAAGSYSVTVTDANNCIKSSTFTVGQPAPLSISTLSSDVSCYGGNDGNASVSASGGTSGYTYAWSSGGTDISETGLPAGTYTIVVTDNNNCTSDSTFSISQPDSLSLAFSSVDITCNGGSDGQAAVVPSGGIPNYTYLWSTGGLLDTETGLVAGTYFITVTDNNNCQKTSAVTIEQPDSIAVSVVSSDAACGNNNGSASVSATGGTGTLTYLWSTGDQAQSISSLAPGSFGITVTDASNCTGESFALVNNINGPAVSIASSVDVDCNGGNNGEATVSTSGGTSPFSYLWNNGDQTQTASSLIAGTYFVSVTDDNNCVGITSVEILEPSAISATTTTLDVSCNGNNDGEATVIPSGGASGYSFIWSSGGTLDAETGLAAGTYSVTITDNNGCTSTSGVTISEPDVLSVTVSETQATCNGNNDGQATASGNGGTPGYDYLWSNGGLLATETGLPAGTYSVTITDGHGCSASASVLISEPVLLSASFTGLQTSCFGVADGQATITATGGTPGYSYFWPTGGTLETETGLAAGDYLVTISDANNCSGNVSVTITQPDELLISGSSTDAYCENDNGSANISVSGGNGGYSYSWSTGATDPFISNLSAGSYAAVVTDANGCSKSDTVIISFIPGPVLNTPVVVDPTCYGLSDGEASLSVSGISPYSFLWLNSSGDTLQYSTNVPGTDLLPNVPAGIYSVFVLDNNGCGNTASLTLNQPDEVIASFSTITDTVDIANGATIYTINSSTGTSDYSWDFGDGNSSVLFEPAHSYSTEGTYIITLTAGTDPCTSSFQQTIEVINSVGINENEGISYVKIHVAGEKAIIEYHFPVPEKMEISLFNMIGQKTIEDISICVISGNYELELPVAGGVYFLRVKAGSGEQVRKIFR